MYVEILLINFTTLVQGHEPDDDTGTRSENF